MKDMAIAFIGDPHGRWEEIRTCLRRHLDGGAMISAIVPVGDMELDRPLEAELEEFLAAGIGVYWVHGNHDVDETRWHDNLFGSALAERNIHGRAVRLDGVRLAGLGGIFRGKVWYPRGDGDTTPVFNSRDAYLKICGRSSLWRNGMPLKQRATIFPEDVDALRREKADILVCHEAPSSMVSERDGERIGFDVIDELADAMGAGLIIHGHHHKSYAARLPNGVQVRGLALAEVWIHRRTEGIPASFEERVSA